MSLLEKVSKFESKWCKRKIVRQMIMRYYRFMQLKASFCDNILIIPTLDIEIGWQTHLLRPEKYRTDCVHLFSRIIDHSLFLDEIGQFLKEQAFLDTCQLYQQRFGEPYCFIPVIEKTNTYNCQSFDSYNDESLSYSYWDRTYFKFARKVSCDYENPFSFTEIDIISDNNWFKSCQYFMKKSSLHIGELKRLSDRTIDLNLLKKSYERFLYIAAKHPPQTKNELLHATYAVDI